MSKRVQCVMDENIYKKFKKNIDKNGWNESKAINKMVSSYVNNGNNTDIENKIENLEKQIKMLSEIICNYIKFDFVFTTSNIDESKVNNKKDEAIKFFNEFKNIVINSHNSNNSLSDKFLLNKAG